MKKVLTVLLVLAASAVFVFAAQIDYIYNNSVSSDSFDINPVRGDLFTDEDGNTFAVKSVKGDIVVFDGIHVINKVSRGSELTKTRPVIKARATVSLKTIGVDFSMVLPYVYPLEPFIDVSYEFGKVISAMVGFKITCPLTNLSNSQFFLLKNGSISGYGAVGLNGLGYFGVSGGFEYNYLFRKLMLGAGAQLLMSPFESSAGFVPKVSVGVFL